MIYRDSHGLIVQPDYNYEDYWNHTDAGDTASRTGIMALCGSDTDRLLLLIMASLPLSRHPYDEKWSNPKLMSRDQLICLAAGFSIIPLQMKQVGWFINSDILTPSHKAHLKRCNKEEMSWLFQKISDLWLFCDMIWSTKVNPDLEQNQLICMLIVRGKPWAKLYTKLYPDFRAHLVQYWDSWRKQPEIAHRMIDKIEEILNEKET